MVAGNAFHRGACVQVYVCVGATHGCLLVLHRDINLIINMGWETHRGEEGYAPYCGVCVC